MRQGSASVNPWHDLATWADQERGLVQAVIEIPKGSKIKCELDKESGDLRVDRILYSPVIYPANYGFVPRTECEDGDPLISSRARASSAMSSPSSGVRNVEFRALMRSRVISMTIAAPVSAARP